MFLLKLRSRFASLLFVHTYNNEWLVCSVLLILALCASSGWIETRRIDMQCDPNHKPKDSEEAEITCFVAGRHDFAEGDELNITNANQFVNATSFKMSAASSNVAVVPATIFETFSQLKRIRISSAIAKLSSITFIAANRLERIDLAKNHLAEILARLFVGAPKLQEIDFSENRIDHIDDYAFDRLPELEFLFLQSNRLAVLKRHTFSGAQNLRGLQLEDNEIETIEDGAFDLPLLKSLFLGHNKLSVLADGTFNGAPNLYGVDAKSNRLMRIGEAFYRCQHLGALILDHNSIADISLQRFAALPELLQLSLKKSGFNFTAFKPNGARKSSIRFLDISWNGIDDANILRRLDGIFGNLDELNLEQNQLADINDLRNITMYFPNISLLELSGNPIECNRLRDVIAYLRRRKITVPRTVPTDSHMANVNGVICTKTDLNK